MKLKFVKWIRVPVTFKLPDGTEKEGYRYMDIDGRTMAEALKGEVYPSAAREAAMVMSLEAKAQESQAKKEAEEKAQQEQAEADARAEWDAVRAKMKEQLKK